MGERRTAKPHTVFQNSFHSFHLGVAASCHGESTSLLGRCREVLGNQGQGFWDAFTKSIPLKFVRCCNTMARSLSSSCPACFLPLHDGNATSVVRSSSRRVRGSAPFSPQSIGNISPARRQCRDQGTRFRLQFRAQTEQQTVTTPSLDDTYRCL